MTDSTCSPGACPVGNVYDKYGSRNPATRLLMRRFRARIGAHIRTVSPESVLDAGCGEGVLTRKIAEMLPGARVVGLDVPSPVLREHWRTHADAEFVEGSVYSLPFTDREFSLVVALEVLEHLERPAEAMRELVRVSAGWLLLSVPREPLWRVMNVLSGRYLSELGNTPGHVQHWSRKAFEQLVSQGGATAKISGPLPWTVGLVEKQRPLS